MNMLSAKYVNVSLQYILIYIYIFTYIYITQQYVSSAVGTPIVCKEQVRQSLLVLAPVRHSKLCVIWKKKTIAKRKQIKQHTTITSTHTGPWNPAHLTSNRTRKMNKEAVSLLVMQCSAGKRRLRSNPCRTDRMLGRWTSCSTNRWLWNLQPQLQSHTPGTWQSAHCCQYLLPSSDS